MVGLFMASMNPNRHQNTDNAEMGQGANKTKCWKGITDNSTDSNREGPKVAPLHSIQQIVREWSPKTKFKFLGGVARKYKPDCTEESRDPSPGGWMPRGE